MQDKRTSLDLKREAFSVPLRMYTLLNPITFGTDC